MYLAVPDYKPKLHDMAVLSLMLEGGASKPFKCCSKVTMKATSG